MKTDPRDRVIDLALGLAALKAAAIMQVPRMAQDASEETGGTLHSDKERPSVPVANTAADSNALLCGRRGCPREAKRGRKHGGFCSDTCRSWAHRHPEDDIRKERLCLVRRGKKRDPWREAQKPQTRKVLAMLQAGPRTTHDFLAAYIGRFGARLGELRAVGHRISTEKLSEQSARYTLEKYMVLGLEVVKVPGVGDMEQPSTTTRLSCSEFSNYIDRLLRWGGEKGISVRAAGEAE